MAYGDFKDLNRRTASDKLLRDKAFNMTKILKYDEYQRELAPMVHEFVGERTSSTATKMRLFQIRNYQENYTNQLLDNLRKVQSSFIDNVCSTDLADVQWINK